MYGYPGYPRRGNSVFFFIIYLIFGAYFINYSLKFIPIPAAVDPINRWIILGGGILIVIGAINLLRQNRMNRYY